MEPPTYALQKRSPTYCDHGQGLLLVAHARAHLGLSSIREVNDGQESHHRQREEGREGQIMVIMRLMKPLEGRWYTR